MGEKIIVRQNRHFETDILAQDPHHPEDLTFHSVEAVYHLTPYGMMLSGLGSCTAIVLHTYAQNHGLPLDEVELHLVYERVFEDDCQECESIQEYREQIVETIALTGDLTPEQKQRLFAVSRHCPIHKLMVHGIEIDSRLDAD
ncbi:MAG: OsmC family protein [Anaerolineae bacterium]|nr:OsmC family protein [Anaerolineae bacterium]